MIKRWYRLHILGLPYGIVMALECKEYIEKEHIEKLSNIEQAIRVLVLILILSGFAILIISIT